MRITRLLCVIATCLFAMTASVQASVQYVTVVADGSGTTPQAAVYDAIKNAIEQVNGTKISAATSLSTAEVSASSSTGESAHVASEAFMQQVVSQTKGAIKSYRILQSGSDPSLGNLNTAQLEVVVAKFQASAQLNRKRLAIMPFRLDPSIPSQDGDIIGQAFDQTLVTFLTQTRKFALLERQYLAEQQAELGIVTSGQTPVEELARLGQMVAADIILVGTITKASKSAKTISSAATGVSFTSYVGQVEVSYRVVDSATGQIKWADTASSKSESQNAAGLLTRLSRRVAEEIGENILDAIYPVAVAAVSGDELVLGQGGKTMEVGQRFQLIMLGQKIIDTHTGESLGAEEIVVGEVEIVSVTPKQSRARVIEASRDPFNGFQNNSFIVRPLARPKAVAQKSIAQPKAVKKKLQEGFSTFEKQNSDQW